jgi:hypothetical protein
MAVGVMEVMLLCILSRVGVKRTILISVHEQISTIVKQGKDKVFYVGDCLVSVRVVLFVV